MCVCICGFIISSSERCLGELNTSGICRVEIMFVHFLVDELVSHKSTRSSLMWHSQTVVHEDEENDVHFSKRAPFSK